MKKTLAALAVLGAFAAGSAYAADVTLYGIVDLGLTYQHSDKDDGTDATDSFTMSSGNQSGSRFGLKGTEDLGNGYSVGFVLENGFSADDGKLGNNGRLFGREAQVHVTGPWGELAFGRMGQLTSGNGSYGIAGNMSPFGASWAGSVELSTYMVGAQRMDNMVTYKSPTFAGVNVYAQYSFDNNTKDSWTDADGKLGNDEGKATSNRYAGIGATYGNGGLNLVATADWYNWSNNAEADASVNKFDAGWDIDDGYAFTLGGSYDFGVVRAYLSGQYFDNMLMKSSTGTDVTDTYAKIGTGTSGFIQGYAFMAGVDAPVFGGTAMFALGYASTEDAVVKTGAKKAESDRFGAAIGYTYNLSKRTNLYGVASWYQDSIDNEAYAKSETGYRDRDPQTYQVVVGLRHRF